MNACIGLFFYEKIHPFILLVFAIVIAIKSVVESIEEFNRNLVMLRDVEIFSSYERHYCFRKSNPLPSLAGIWCAKEAFCQAIADFPEFPPCLWADFEVRHNVSGRPWIRLNNSLTNVCQEQGLAIDLSISHAGLFAAASVLLYSVGCDQSEAWKTLQSLSSSVSSPRHSLKKSPKFL